VKFKKILIINTFGIGDVLFTTPLISNLKAHDPNLYIGYLSNRRTAPLLKRNKKINRVFIYERDEFYETRQKSQIAFLKKFRMFLKSIKEEEFDLVLDVSLNGMMSFFTWVVGIKQRIGFNYKNRSLFLSKKIPLKGYEGQHVSQHYLMLLEELGVPIRSKELELTLNQEDHQWVRGFCDQNGVNFEGNPVIGIVPGGGASWGKDASYKRWSATKFAKLADKLIEKFCATIILLGDKTELELCVEVSEAMSQRSIMACGETTISQFAALARECSLTIVNDGGPLHIAVAVGARTVSIFGPVDKN